MNLSNLISELRKRDPSIRVLNGFGSGHSDRGDYYNVAFDPVEETTIGEMLKSALDVLDTECQGWKGGEFLMHGGVTALIGEYGCCGEEITRHHFLYWDALAANAQADRAGGDKP